MKFTLEDVLNAVARVKQEKIESNEYDLIIPKDEWSNVVYKVEMLEKALEERFLWLSRNCDLNVIVRKELMKQILEVLGKPDLASGNVNKEH